MAGLTVSSRHLLNSLQEEDKHQGTIPVSQEKEKQNRISSILLRGGMHLARNSLSATDAESAARLGSDQVVAECDVLIPDQDDDDSQGLSESYTIESLEILETIIHKEIRKHSCKRWLGVVAADLERQASMFQQLCFKTLKEALVFFLVTRNVRLLNGPKEFVPQWLQLLTEILEVERATVFLWDSNQGELYSRCATGGLSQAIRLKSGCGIAGVVYATGQPMIVEKAYCHPRFNPVIDKKTHFRTRNICCVPLRLGDKIIGCVQLLNKLHGLNFVNDDISFLQTVSDYVGHVFTYSPFLDNADAILHSEEVWSTHALHAMIPKEPLQSPEGNPALHWLTSAIADALDAEHCSIWMNTPGSLTLQATTLQQELADDPRPRSALAERVTEFGTCVNVVDAARDTRFKADSERPSPHTTRTMVCIPLMPEDQDADEKPTGCIQLFNKLQDRVFNTLDIQKLQGFEQVINSMHAGGCRVLSLSCALSHMKEIFSKFPAATLLVDRRGVVVQANSEASWIMRKLAANKDVDADTLGVIRNNSSCIDKNFPVGLCLSDLW
ncbi:GAF domain protein [Toxoplasma gondii VAND]|uniref:GAF domain protein n=2 Tax=Toxoplasma gondii TaxID=5811 RepID=A0A086PGB8_TOXGO|nr:GAF domain protein [Toxoplasma gondii VAND]KFH01561.1 putative 3'5'-cyclic nucleotide phosphodiesterase family, related protein [Toxoplasma gondii MAS]